MADFTVNGVDFSAWDGEVNFAVTKSKGVQFVVLRLGSINNVTGETYDDYQIERNLDLAPQYFNAVLHYWFYRANHDATKQIDHIYNILRDKAVTLAPVLDIEDTSGITPAKAADNIEKAYTLLGQAFSHTPCKIVYTRQSMWDCSVAKRPTWATLKLWAAIYSNVLTSPWSSGHYVFRDWTDWALWQWSADSPPNNLGAAYGSHGTSVDLDRFNGDAVKFNAMFGMNIPTDNVPIPPVVVPTRVKMLSNVRVRSTPAELADLSNVIGQAYQNSIWYVDGYAVDTLGRVWFSTGNSHAYLASWVVAAV